jgi:hypothetical protein
MGVRPIEVTIDALVLDGVAPGDERVARQVERAAREALAGRPDARRADPAAIARAVASALAGRPREVR